MDLGKILDVLVKSKLHALAGIAVGAALAVAVLLSSEALREAPAVVGFALIIACCAGGMFVAGFLAKAFHVCATALKKRLRRYSSQRRLSRLPQLLLGLTDVEKEFLLAAYRQGKPSILVDYRQEHIAAALVHKGILWRSDGLIALDGGTFYMVATDTWRTICADPSLIGM